MNGLSSGRARISPSRSDSRCDRCCDRCCDSRGKWGVRNVRATTRTAGAKNRRCGPQRHADHAWDENSTPAIAHIEGNDVDFYHAVTPDAEGNKALPRSNSPRATTP